MAYEELFIDLSRAECKEKTNPRYTFVVKGHFSKAKWRTTFASVYDLYQ